MNDALENVRMLLREQMSRLHQPAARPPVAADVPAMMERVRQFLRSRGYHATADLVHFSRADGGQVADVAVRVATVTSPGRE